MDSNRRQMRYAARLAKNNRVEKFRVFAIVINTPPLHRLDPIQLFMKFFYGVMVCAFLLAHSAFGQGSPEQKFMGQNGEQILQQMASKYAAVNSYRDTGEVHVNLKGLKPSVTNTFNTYFVRPDRYRFEWYTAGSDDAKWNVIWSNSGSFYSLDASGVREREYRSGRTISTAASVSRGASQTVAALLTTGIGGFRLSQLDRVSLLRKETFEGKLCYVVRGFHPLGFAVELWITADDSLLRKIRQINNDGSFQEEIRRNIVVDEPISPNTFEYKARKMGVKTVA